MGEVIDLSNHSPDVREHEKTTLFREALYYSFVGLYVAEALEDPAREELKFYHERIVIEAMICGLQNRELKKIYRSARLDVFGDQPKPTEDSPVNF